MRYAIISALLLCGCSTRTSPTAVPPAPIPIVEPPTPTWTFKNLSSIEISSDIVGPALDRAEAGIKRIRDEGLKVTPFSVVLVPTDYANSVGGKFFYFDQYVTPEMGGFLKLSLPSAVLGGHVLGVGITDTWAYPPMIYVLADHPDVSSTLAHELVHLLWFENWPDERCVNGFPVWANTYHGTACDPFK